MENMEAIQTEFGRLVEIMARLRAPDGCPWDREQSYESLRQYLLEETYEVLELIDSKQYDELKNELGDLLLQVVFQAQIAAEEGRFTILDVLKKINQKLIHRHSNVFGDVVVRNAEEQTINWENMKKQEDRTRSVIDGVPRQLSALLRAHRMQAKAATVGFDWENASQVWEKVEEELRELKGSIERQVPEEMELEFGDLLFALVNLSRFIRVNPEDALRKAIEKFSTRFRQLEQRAALANRSLNDMTLQEMDQIWDEIKNESRQQALLEPITK
ncbi:MAG: nucleoside triphosphate pyrophosphohydrolase [candidate division KSB1 bacterium]|nr:nucleoside triphosphate pyrophosphohydrolase [candidate division KSB1 bacterium]MDZ7334127.1 nucleoside triphosphate pyrophosphohydrolase [candidate division KSB1 bacterium]MDZ7356284.1 nucleoside triphosphate pyrophosphohydrolase [candidate division KSB1 bacterium]MDZ7401377.1 nucleoside triphosphate pyrophosphohydrolase [candidate division KSB1 bacterium]